ncbi:MAG: hypothetical protein JST86_07115 [Bacteroidetes bacterium]|nr:hypothetical protein [Bacteroidota bacterium]
MKKILFRKTAWVYMPIHPAGFIVTLLAALFMVPVLFSINRNAHSVTDAWYSVFVYASYTAFWWKWVAEKTS